MLSDYIWIFCWEMLSEMTAPLSFFKSFQVIQKPGNDNYRYIKLLSLSFFFLTRLHKHYNQCTYNCLWKNESSNAITAGCWTKQKQQRKSDIQSFLFQEQTVPPILAHSLCFPGSLLVTSTDNTDIITLVHSFSCLPSASQTESILCAVNLSALLSFFATNLLHISASPLGGQPKSSSSSSSVFRLWGVFSHLLSLLGFWRFIWV